MENPSKTLFRIGAWRVNPATGEISREEETIRLEGRAMLLLQCLAERAGEVVSIDELLGRVWAGVIVSPDSVYQAVASLRRQLGDDPKQPTYIATVPRLGYRMVATVTTLTGDETRPAGTSVAAEGSGGEAEAPRISAKWVVMAVVLLGVTIAASWAVLERRRAAGDSFGSPLLAEQNQRSIAVLPFLDLTDGMKEEEFADGMTEELIDRLSKVPDFRVPTATASFYYKGKQMPVAEIARTLGVAYLLDGSVRKSAARFRIAARLVRVSDGYVIWAESYDRPLVDKLLVQEDIAGEVAKALRASIQGG